MFYKQSMRGRGQQPTAWKQYSRKGYSAFASLGRQIRIGALAVSTLASVAPVVAETTSRESQTLGEEAEEKTLREVSVTGTMAPLTELQSARIVSVLTRKDIEQAAGAQSVNDLLKLASGVDVRQRGGFGIQTDISIDGGTFDQITLLLNGVNISNPHTGHLAMDLPVSIQDIERIEILEGASSRVYGGTAFGGCINIVTRRDKENLVEAQVEGGSHATIVGEARMGLQTGRVANRLSSGGGRTNGGTENSDWRKAQLYYQGDYTGEALDLQWQLGFSKKNYGANTFYSAAYPDQYERNERYMASLTGETRGRFRLRPQVWWTRTYDNFELVRGERFGENFHQVDVYGLKLTGHVDWALGKTALGAEVSNEGILSTNLGRPMEETERVSVHSREKDIWYDHRDNRTNVSYNLEHNLLFPHWTLSAGLIAAMSTSVDHRYRFYPGVDIAWRPHALWKVYASYSKGFRLPTFTDLYYRSPTLMGNAGLRPEVNHSMQLGVRFRDAQRGLEGTVRAFLHRGHRMIDWVMLSSDDIYHSTSFNLDNMGMQAEGRVDFPRLLGKDTWLRSLTVGYTYMHQRRHDPEAIYKSNYALEYLRHKLTATLSHRIVSRLSASWNLRWQERMGNYILYEGTYRDPDTGRLRGQTQGELRRYSPYATLDVRLTWRAPRYQLWLEAANLTNRHYHDLGNIPQPGTWVMAGGRVTLKL